MWASANKAPAMSSGTKSDISAKLSACIAGGRSNMMNLLLFSESNGAVDLSWQFKPTWGPAATGSIAAALVSYGPPTPSQLAVSVATSLYSCEYIECPVSRPRELLGSVYDIAPADRKNTPLAELMSVATRNAANAADSPRRTPHRRNKIWELHSHLHCSIIGTCLTADELRRLLVRLNVAGADTAGDHDMHMLGVLLAARAEEGAKHLQKTLDRRHRVALNRFAKAQDAEALCELWEAAMKGGDLPGAYWALLTHPLTTDLMARHAFGDVHMLSHLVGATNRADLTRMRELEKQVGELTDKLERQQRQLRDGFVARDETIRTLNQALARAAASPAEQSAYSDRDDIIALRQTVTTLGAQIEDECNRRKRIEQRLVAVSASLDEARRARLAVERERDVIQGESAAIEAEIARLLDPGRPGRDAIDLSGITVLYVGSRTNQVPQLRALIERSGGCSLHHDGGLEHSASLLPGLISRANVAMFPVDCISHDAMAAVKRLCRQAAKPFWPLRTSSLSCLMSAFPSLRKRLQETAHAGASGLA